MNQTKIIGHRGAKGLEFENTVKGFKLARQLPGIDAIELDVMSTRDGKIVVCHDYNLMRLSGKFKLVPLMTYEQLAEIHLQNGETIPLLYDVLALLKGMPVVLDIKTTRYIENIFAALEHYPDIKFTIVTWLPSIIKKCKRIRPDIPVFVERYLSPLFLMHSVRRHKADGLNLNHRWLNPRTYRAAIRKGYQIQVYTINDVRIAQRIKRQYPGVWICTNFPDVLVKHLQ